MRLRSQERSVVEQQLRMYTVKPGALGSFVEEWSEKVVPLRERHGFSVVGAWINQEENRFVWIVSYNGPGSFADRAAEYYEDPERVGIDPDPTRHLDAVETWMVSAVTNDGA